jgi:hypothetical protein
MGDGRQRQGDNVMALQPQTREEIARTIFVGNIPAGVGGDEGMTNILRSVGNLRRWTRAIDAHNKPCTFGFAEYEDAESLETAAEVLKDVQVPTFKQEPGGVKVKQEPVTEKIKQEPGTEEMEVDEKKEEEVKKTTLLVVVDEASLKYAQEWKAKRGEDEAASQFRIDSAKEQLASVIAGLFHPQAPLQADVDDNMRRQEYEMAGDRANAEIVTIPLSTEDELAEIPEDMRDMVAAEIASFRDRSNRRDMEQLRREQEIEAEGARNTSRVNRLTSPPATAPSGPGGGSNGIPLGPRGERGVQGAPSGPRGYQGSQMPRDYQAGVSFVNGGAVSSGSTSQTWVRREDEEDSASDSEIERRNQQQKNADLDRLAADLLRRWEHREQKRSVALDREENRRVRELAHAESTKVRMAAKLKDYDDDVEAQNKHEDYYRDHSHWLRAREQFRRHEAAADAIDREAEEREKAAEYQKRESVRGMADSFLERQAEEIESRMPSRKPQQFKMSLGAAAQKIQKAAAQRRTAAEVEFLLEDDEEVTETAKKRTLVPIQFDPSTEPAYLTEEERQAAQKQLAADIPTDLDNLFGWNVAWDHVDETLVNEQIKGFVEKKIVEYLGVQEDLLVETVTDHLKKRGKPQDLIGDLKEALDEEAEDLVKRLWRMLIFYSESEKRGISR